MTLIPVAGPSITQLEIDYVADAAAHSWGDNANTYYERFHAAFSEYVGVRHAVSLPSCTSGLHLSLAALGIGPGDEVIVPDVTWIASVAPVRYVGATPVFCDIDPDTWCLSVDSFRECITERTKAVVPVEIYGSMPNWDALLRVAREHGISVVEDAAEAFGSQYGGKMAGSFGETGCFSFHGSKTVTTGEGGMLVTDDSDLFDRILFLRDHGRVPGDVSFVNAEVAFKYKMSAMQAAMGLAQVERAQELVKKKRTVFGWYRDRLEGVDGIFLNTEPEGVLNSYWMSTVILDPGFGLDKFDVIRELKARGIATRPFFSPLSSLPAFAASEQAKRASGRNIIGYRISRYGINLPSGLQLQETDVRRVCNALKEILGGTPWK